MKSILNLSAKKARDFLLKGENYSRIDLPAYFTFQELLNKISEKLNKSSLSEFRNSSPRDYNDVNYKLLSNKDGKYAWRPFQLIHPAIYVSLVHQITDSKNWNTIKARFKEFRKNKKIECHSLPVQSEEDLKTDKSAQILYWWQMIEQQSITLSMEYNFVLQTDITDCYGTIYTHSIPWAIHTKTIAKQKKNRNNKSFVGVVIDNHLQDMSYGQTNGIPQGSSLMDFIAEIVLGYVDLQLGEKLDQLKITNYKILRFRDDYRIFTKDSFIAEQITKELSEILSQLGMRLNPEKTVASNDIITTSIKEDKRYWIENKRIADNKQKWLIQIYMLSQKFPNSGTLDIQMKEFLKVLEKSKKEDPNLYTLISIVTEIAIRNPRVIPSAIAILSILINRLKSKRTKIIIANKIKSKFAEVPNSSLIMIWFQRLYMELNKKQTYQEGLCKRVILDKQTIWNSTWLDKGLKDIVDKTQIVKPKEVKETKVKFSLEEIMKIVKKKSYYG